MRELERRVLLSVLDRKWREHLYEMDYLREGIGLRAYSQRDPLVEYQREGFDMFNAMKEGIREETVGFLFNLEVQVEEEPEDEPRLDRSACSPTGRTRAAPLGGRPRIVGGGPRRSRPRPRHGEHHHDHDEHHAPIIRAKGLDAPGAAEPDLLRTQRGRRGRGEGAAGEQRRRPVRRGEPQRRVPLRLGQEVQEVPRRPGWSHRPHSARHTAEARRTSTGSAELQGGAAPPSLHGSSRAAMARDRSPWRTCTLSSAASGEGQNTCTLRTWLRSRRTRRSPGVVRWSSCGPPAAAPRRPARWSSAAAGPGHGRRRPPRQPRSRTGGRTPRARCSTTGHQPQVSARVLTHLHGPRRRGEVEGEGALDAGHRDGGGQGLPDVGGHGRWVSFSVRVGAGSRCRGRTRCWPGRIRSGSGPIRERFSSCSRWTRRATSAAVPAPGSCAVASPHNVSPARTTSRVASSR